MLIDHPTKARKDRKGVFISYARGDGEAFAAKLREQLIAEGIEPWRDRDAMEGGRDWWLQITEALDHVVFMALVVTPNALKSDIVRKEWRYARQQGVCVYPIKGSAGIDFNSLPRWMRDAHFYDLGTIENNLTGPEWKTFVNDLHKTPDARRVPFMVEDLPEDFVERPVEYDQLLSLLLDEKREEPVAITAALRGAGGYGKTTLAKALCHDPRIQDAFDDGILWMTLGENPGDLTRRVEDLIYTLNNERPGYTGVDAAAARLAELLADRDILIVIDDAWNGAHLRPFMQGGERCARLITTRNLETLPGKARQVKVDQMRLEEAAALLTKGLDERFDDQTTVNSLGALAERLGRWALLVKLVNGTLRDRVIETHEPLARAIAYANKALDKRGLTAFDVRDSDEREDAVKKTLGVSLERLSAEEHDGFGSLAIFPEDADVPMRTLGKFWGLDDLDTDDRCERFYQLSLLANFDRETRTIRLHDVIRKYLIEQNRDRLNELHNRLLDAHRPAANWSELPEDEPYLWDHLASHLIEAGRGDELVVTVKDWRYLAKKTLLKKSLLVEGDLVKAEKIASADDELRTLRRSFANTGHLFNHCETRNAIEATFFVRLQHLPHLGVILQDLAQRLERPYIVPKFDLPDLPHPALIRTLESHSSFVRSCAVSSDGNLIVSASSDRTLKVWDAQTGEMLRTLEGHSSVVQSCAVSPDGKLIVSASDDHTLKIWDTQTGETLRTLEGHSAGVSSCVISPGGKLIISASHDNTLKVWSVRTGEMLRTLKGRSTVVSDCAISPDGKLIVSASYDNTLKVWDAQTGEMLRTLKGHSDPVFGCAFSPDGKQVVSASNTLKVWDAATGEMLLTLEGHSSRVYCCAISPDGKLIVSASDDGMLKVWDAQTGKLLSTLEGHSASVNGCVLSPDGKLIVSASSDRTLKVWDLQTGGMLNTPEGHSSWVNGCAISPNGKLIVSASQDSKLRIWDVLTGEKLRTLEGHSSWVSDCAISPDGRLIVSASDDDTLKVWGAQTGELLRTLEGHSASVYGCVINPDGKLIVSASFDGTLRVWNAQTGEMLRVLGVYPASISDCVISPDGKLIVSASFDRTLKVWDMQTGEMLRTLKGHSKSATGCAISLDGELTVSASDDGTLKVWRAQTGETLRTLEGHLASVTDCAISHDGKLIISASQDRTLRIWDAQTGKSLVTFYADGPMLCCAIHGEMIVAGGVRGVYFLKLIQ